MLKRVSRFAAQVLLVLLWYTAWPINVSRWTWQTPYLTRRVRLVLYAYCGIGLFLLVAGWFFWSAHPDQVLDIIIGTAPMYYPLGAKAVSLAHETAKQR